MSKTRNSELTAQYIHQLAHNLYFAIDDEQCENLLVEFNVIKKQLENVINFDTTNVLPLDYPFEIVKKTYLRPDKNPASLLTTNEVLSCAPSVLGNYIAINRVINNEN